ncbi:M1 family metallopeptidase [Thalassomonas haliotis]|uniref:Aminopeptidase N n=1 Tax=Thalassomonas haliotis TaxID=485448 RepID=A0ABY7VG38_9GAMM|nr:M1 family metallopeptidase [Thalassomonas haliotis]WDE12435.1 M1 family metallopeptidase [Thalassomonas haliotis]
MNTGAAYALTTDLGEKADYDVLHYDARLTANLAAKAIDGRVTVTAKKLSGGERPLVLSAKYKTAIKVSSDNVKLSYQILEDDLVINFHSPLTRGQSFSVDIEYHAAPKRGMRFYPDHMFTVYHTGNWLVSHGNIADKASFDLTLVHDQKLKTIANGRLVSQKSAPTGKMHSHWQQQTPIPLYTFGFALGDFQLHSTAYNNQAINFFYRPRPLSGLNRQKIKDIFADVPDMMRFFEEKSAIALPNKQYSYVLVPGTIAQEAAGFSMVGEKFAHTVLEQPGENWFIAHELAHEWWGNSITCAGFSHFWLNEGLVQFMVAAYQQQLFGEPAYHREIKLALNRVKKAAEKGRNSPLAFFTEIAEQDINHSIVYNKGALVFYLLREKLGEKHFWQALKTYSLTFAGKSVVTDDLKRVFEQVSGTDLSAFFQRWVYGEEIPELSF